MVELDFCTSGDLLPCAPFVEHVSCLKNSYFANVNFFCFGGCGWVLHRRLFHVRGLNSVCSAGTDTAKAQVATWPPPWMTRSGLGATFEVGNLCFLCGIRSSVSPWGGSLLVLISDYMELSRIVYS